MLWVAVPGHHSNSFKTQYLFAGFGCAATLYRENRVHRLGEPGLAPPRPLGVMLPNDGCAVAQHFSHVLIRPALLQQFCSERVPEAVRVRVRQAGGSEHRR
jgi:hypothetical protein